MVKYKIIDTIYKKKKHFFYLLFGCPMANMGQLLTGCRSFARKHCNIFNTPFTEKTDY